MSQPEAWVDFKTFIEPITKIMGERGRLVLVQAKSGWRGYVDKSRIHLNGVSYADLKKGVVRMEPEPAEHPGAYCPCEICQSKWVGDE